MIVNNCFFSIFYNYIESFDLYVLIVLIYRITENYIEKSGINLQNYVDIYQRETYQRHV